MGVSDDLRIVSAGAMPPDPLREKLKALVEDLRPPLDPDEAKNDRYWLGWNDCLDTLLREDALLAESDPEPCPERPGCGRDHGGGSWNANCPDCEAKAKLPLGHEWQGILGLAGTTGPCTYRIDEQRGFRDCGQPRSAHEPK